MPIIDKTIYRDVFNFHAERLEALEKCPEKGLNAYWDHTCNTMMGIAANHNNDLFCVEMLVAVHADLDRQYQRRWTREHNHQTVV